MLIRIHGAYVNLATISEAVLHDDDGVTLRWGAHVRHVTGAEAETVCRALEKLAAGEKAEPPRPERPTPPVPPPAPPRTAVAEAAPAILQLRMPEPARAAPADDDLDDFDAEEKPQSALSRRADLVRNFEPIASLSHKHRGAFLAAIEKATDFNHLPPKYRRLIQDAEANRRQEMRK